MCYVCTIYSLVKLIIFSYIDHKKKVFIGVIVLYYLEAYALSYDEHKEVFIEV